MGNSGSQGSPDGPPDPGPATELKLDGTPGSPPDEPPPRSVYGRYKIERLLGRGGMGAVYLARQTDLDRPAVVKVIHATLARDPVIVERLRREARAAAKIQSDNVVTVYEFGTEDGAPFIAMEYVDGRTLSEILVERRRLPFEEATRIVLAAANGLKAAHEAGVLHRDVKPANILLSRTGAVKLVDFGIAKQLTNGGASEATPQTLSRVGEVIGTPDYMPLEQAQGKTLDGRADLYSLGVTYYQLLSGELPFRGPSALVTLTNLLQGDYTPLRERVPGLPEKVWRACDRLMARTPDERPPTAGAAAEALARVLGTALMASPSLGRETRGRDPAPGSPGGERSRGEATLAGAPGPGLKTGPRAVGRDAPKTAPRVVVRKEETSSAIPLLALVAALAVIGGMVWLARRPKHQPAPTPSPVQASPSPVGDAPSPEPIEAPDVGSSPTPNPAGGDEAQLLSRIFALPPHRRLAEISTLQGRTFRRETIDRLGAEVARLSPVETPLQRLRSEIVYALHSRDDDRVQLASARFANELSHLPLAPEDAPAYGEGARRLASLSRLVASLEQAYSRVVGETSKPDYLGLTPDAVFTALAKTSQSDDVRRGAAVVAAASLVKLPAALEPASWSEVDDVLIELDLPRPAIAR